MSPNLDALSAVCSFVRAQTLCQYYSSMSTIPEIGASDTPSNATRNQSVVISAHNSFGCCLCGSCLRRVTTVGKNTEACMIEARGR